VLRSALLFLALLLGASSAFAYPATTTLNCAYTWLTNYGSGTCSDDASCKSAVLASVDPAGYAGKPKGWWLNGASWFQGSSTPPPGGSIVCLANDSQAQANLAYQHTDGNWYNIANAAVRATRTGGSSTTCPGGGTLSGSTCTCAQGETDTGSACVPPSCPDHQFWDLTQCANKCPPAGNAWMADDHARSFAAGGILVPKGGKTTCMPVEYGNPTSGFGAMCRVEATSTVMACDDNGCFSELARYTGEMCAPAVPPPSNPPPAPDDLYGDPTPTVCETGDVWCFSPTGACGSGYTAGTVNDETICAKVGEPITIVPQDKSPNIPPLVPSPQPNSWTNPSARPGESINPSSRLVVSIGGGATSFPGTGSGGGGESDGECGLPNTPPCKIDETGTPNGSGVSDQQGAVNAGAASLGSALNGVVDGSGPKPAGIGWGITSIMFPTNCTPFVLDAGRWGSVEVDLCQYQPIIHDLMSLVWASFGLILCVGMVFRTVTTGGA